MPTVDDPAQIDDQFDTFSFEGLLTLNEIQANFLTFMEKLIADDKMERVLKKTNVVARIDRVNLCS